MHNWLIFQYHRVHAHSKFEVLRGCSFGSEPTNSEADSKGGTQEGR